MAVVAVGLLLVLCLLQAVSASIEGHFVTFSRGRRFGLLIDGVWGLAA